MPDQPIHLSTGGLPETIIPNYDNEALAALSVALGSPETQRKALVAKVAADWPRYLDAWVALGQLSTDPTERYAYFRVGYHRGLIRKLHQVPFGLSPRSEKREPSERRVSPLGS